MCQSERVPAHIYILRVAHSAFYTDGDYIVAWQQMDPGLRFIQPENPAYEQLSRNEVSKRPKYRNKHFLFIEVQPNTRWLNGSHIQGCAYYTV